VSKKKKKKGKKALYPATPPAPTKLPGGVAKIIQIAEDLRERNRDGYLQHIGGILANIKEHGSLKTPPKTTATTCSPFTTTVMGVAFDPVYPRDDLNGDPYVPMYDGGTKPLMPFNKFYRAANSSEEGTNEDTPVNAIVAYGLGVEIEPTEVRRGDLIEIDWMDGGGHAVFCWDVHLDADGNVDCLQFIGSNSQGGVTIHGCHGSRWLSGKNAKMEHHPGEKPAWVITERGTYAKAKDKIFVDEDEIVAQGDWYGLPGITDIDVKTFRVKPKHIRYSKKSKKKTFRKIRCGRFFYDGDPPVPFCMKDGPAAPPQKPGHVDAPAVKVKGEDIKKDPAAPKKVKPKKAKQEKDKPLELQRFVELSLHQFYDRLWIETDPGEPDDINDEKTQAALKELQKMFGIGVDGIIGDDTLKVVSEQVGACTSQSSSQQLLIELHQGKKLDHDPGPADFRNNEKTRAAVEEFQKKESLKVTGVPDAKTQARLIEVVRGHAATTDKPGLRPELEALYWVGNTVAVGGKARLRLHARDMKLQLRVAIRLHDEVSGDDADVTVDVALDGTDADIALKVPDVFAIGAKVQAAVSVDAGDKGKLELETKAALMVAAALESEPADWRAYIDGGEVPQDVLDAIARNRARYPLKTLPLVKKGKYKGPLHYDYKPPKSHRKWAADYAKTTKVDPVAANHIEWMIGRAFVHMLKNEGLPASFQTYDSQIITWGVGLGGKGDGVHVYPKLNADPEMKRILDGLGIDCRKERKVGFRYHVVDLEAKKVQSSTMKARAHKKKRMDHGDPLNAVRRQPDLMSALIGISEEPATRERVLESQWEVYLSNSARWPGQDKVITMALWFMITHMQHWLPAIAKRGVDVEKEFAALGGGTPSLETEKELALRVARAFVRYAKKFYADKPNSYEDVHTRTRTKLWAQMVEDGKEEGFAPGKLTYEEEEAGEAAAE
jgi:peptidoglycan hydrolase-like protein with peptidoglycan-binding domain